MQEGELPEQQARPPRGGPLADPKMWGGKPADRDVTLDALEQLQERITLALAELDSEPRRLYISDVARAPDAAFDRLGVVLSERDLRLLRFALFVALGNP